MFSTIFKLALTISSCILIVYELAGNGMARDKIFTVRLSDKEDRMLELLAESEGLSEADYIRTQVILLFRQSGLELKESPRL